MFVLASVLSLLLCPATVALWVRSYWHWDELDKPWHDSSKLQTDRLYIYSNCGLMVFSYGRFNYATREVMENWNNMRGTRLDEHTSIAIASKPANHRFNEGLAGNRWWNWMGFRVTEVNNELFRLDVWRTWRWVNVPHWALAAVFAVLPACCFVSLRYRRVGKAGFCSTCSYCLTANTSGICPECGSPVLQVSRPAREYVILSPSNATL